MIKFHHTKELNVVQIFYILALIKRGGGMCPMKPGNRQGDSLERCQFTQSLITLEDERKASFFTCLSAHAERFFLFHLRKPSHERQKLTNNVENTTKFIGFIG
jgi:hypothetical protein